MHGNGIAVRRPVERVLAPPGDGLVEKAEVPRCLEIVVERLERPDDDISVTHSILDDRIRFEHEPLWPAALRLILLSEDNSQDLLDGMVMFQRKQELDWPLADVAGSPGGTGILFEPVRHAQMDLRIVGEPREQRVEGGAFGPAACDTEVAGDAFPIACGWRKDIPIADAALIFDGKLFRSVRICHRTGGGETERAHQPRPKRQIGPLPGLPIGVEQLVATECIDRFRRACNEMIDSVGVMLAPNRILVWTQGKSLGLRVDFDTAFVVEFTLPQHQMPEDEEAARFAFDFDAPLHRWVFAGCGGMHADRACVETIDPAAIG